MTTVSLAVVVLVEIGTVKYVSFDSLVDLMVKNHANWIPSPQSIFRNHEWVSTQKVCAPLSHTVEIRFVSSVIFAWL